MSPSPDVTATAGYIESNGKVWVQGAWTAANRLGRPDAGEDYLAAIAKIIGGTVRRYEKSAPEVVDDAGRGTDVADLLGNGNDWKRAIAALAADLSTPT